MVDAARFVKRFFCNHAPEHQAARLLPSGNGQTLRESDGQQPGCFAI